MPSREMLSFMLMTHVCTVDPFCLWILCLCIYPMAKVDVWAQDEHL